MKKTTEEIEVNNDSVIESELKVEEIVNIEEETVSDDNKSEAESTNDSIDEIDALDFEPVKIKGGKGYAFFKRAFDIFCSLLAIIILSPILIIVGILVKLTSKGPMIYVSKRIGKNGKVFNFYKFRSMYRDAEQRLQELLDKNEVKGGITFKMKNDPRITKFGKFIRKTSLDELPQLFNILKGDMSIVGPRPSTDREYKLMNDYHKQRFLVPQGLTGEWQVGGRSTTTFDEMIEMDLNYISKKRGFWYDIKLIFKTIGVIFKKGNGAE